MTDMRVDIAFVGEAASSVAAAENLDVALKHLAEVAVEVSRALANVELPASNVATSVANMKVMERGLNSLENQAQRTKRQLAEVEVFHSGLPNIGGLAPRNFVAGPGSGTGFASRDSSWTELAGVLAKANMWAEANRRRQTQENNLLLNAAKARHDEAQRLGLLFGSGGSQGPYMGGSRKTFPFVDERTGARQGEEYVRGFERVLRRRGASGGGRRGGGFFEGGYRSSLFGESLGAIVPGGARARGPALALGAGLGAVAAAPLVPGLVGLLASIPAAASAAAGALVTLKLAFDDVGKAIGGDKKVYDQLVPSQKKFVDMMRNEVIPLINGAKQVAAAGLFPGLTAAIHQLATSKPFLLAFGNALHTMGKALGDVAQMFSKYLTSSGFLGQFNQLTKGLTPVIHLFGRSLQIWLDVLVRLAVAFQPLLIWLGQMSVKLATMADHWVIATQKAGGFAPMIKRMEDSLVLTVHLIGALSRFLKELVLALIPAGKTLDTSIVGGLNRMATWLHNNHVAVQNFVNNAIKSLIGAFQAVGDIIHAAAGAFKDVHGWLERVTGVTIGARNAFRLLFGAIILKNIVGIALAFLKVASAIRFIATMIYTRLIPAEVAAGTNAEFMAGKIGASATASSLAVGRITAAVGLLSTALLAIAGTVVTIYILEKILPKNIAGAPVSGRDTSKFDSAVIHKAGGGTQEVVNVGDLPPSMSIGGHTYYRSPGTNQFYPTKKAAQSHGSVGTTPAQDAADRKGVPRTSTPRGKPTDATTGGSNVRIYGLTQGLNGSFVSKLKACVGAAGGTDINVDISGKRSDASHPGGPTNHGATNSNHLTGHAIDGHVKIRGTWYPAGAAPMAYSRYGLRPGSSFDWNGSPDIYHVDDGTNVGGVAGTPIVPVGAAAPWHNTGPKPPKPPKPASEASRRAGALAASKDLTAARAAMTELGVLGVHTVTHTIAGETITATVGKTLSKHDANLKKKIAQWERELAHDRKRLLDRKSMTKKELAAIKQHDREISAALAAAKKHEDAEVKARADAFDKAWSDLTDRALAAFDESTDKILAAFDKATSKFLTPTEAAIKALTDARTLRDLNQAVDDAKKNLDDALAGITGDTAQSTLDRITEVIGRYGMAMAIDKAQAAVLGGPLGNFGPDFLKELQNAASPTGGSTVDPEEVRRARQAYGDAVEDVRIYKLQPIAEAEREAQDELDASRRAQLVKDRENLRKGLSDQLAEWGKYWKGVGASAAQAYKIFDQVWFNLTGHHLPPLAGAENTSSTAGSPGSTGGGPTTTGTHVAGTPITSVSSFQQATGTAASAGGGAAAAVGASNTGSAGATAVASKGGASGVVDIWNVNSGTVDIGNLAAGGANLVIQANDPDGQTLRYRAVAAGVAYKVQVVAEQDDTPESFAARVAAAKAAYPDAAGFILDIEGIPEKNADWNTQAAPLAKAAAGGTPISVSNEPNQDINYKAWQNVGADFPVQAYGTNPDGSYIDFDVQSVVDRVVANGVPRELVVPIIHPGQSLGSYKGRYSVFGVVPVAPKAAAAQAPSVSSAAVEQVVAASGIEATPAITAAIQAALTTTEAPLQVFSGPRGSGIKMMAEGGILTRPTLMVGGEAGPEAFVPLSKAKSMLGGDGDPIHVQINVGEGMEWLADFIEVKAVRSAAAIGRVQGRAADARVREGRK